MPSGALQGKITLVTGASRGIGRAIALAAAREGSHLALIARDRERLAQTAAEARLLGVRVHEAPADVSDPSAVEAAVESSAAALGGIQNLVANAGVTYDQLLMRLKPADWDRVIATNLTSAYALCRAAIGGMVRSRQGRIVLLSSIAGLMGNPGQTAYAASKAGLVGFARSLAREVGSRGITVNVVAPGLVDTDMVRAMPATAKDALLANVPLGRLGTAEEVAGAVTFLLGEHAAYITGAILNVSGGLYM
jgi:3-oxoacyl-[acyl-carrier protein] reductase